MSLPFDESLSSLRRVLAPQREAELEIVELWGAVIEGTVPIDVAKLRPERKAHCPAIEQSHARRDLVRLHGSTLNDPLLLEQLGESLFTRQVSKRSFRSILRV